ncbi:MAG: exported protein with glycine-rich C-terminal domain, partial [Acidobacteria bacterium]|nr:exported protein with glycine-rich C-terminal domain [Acidobacteriota bacterium]
HPVLPGQQGYGGGLGAPSLATDGHDFLLLSYRAGTTDARIVRADGSAGAALPLTSSGVGAFTTTGVGGGAYAVWTGSGYLVVITAVVENAMGSYRGQIVALPVSADGAAGEIAVIEDDAEAIGLAPAGPGRALLLWRKGGVVQTGLLTGTALSGTATLGGVSGEVSVAAGDRGFLLANGSTAILLDAGGAPSGSPLALATDGALPRVVWDGESYLAVWSTLPRAMHAARISATGVLSAPFDLGEGSVWSASAAGGRTIVVYATSCLAVASRTIGRGERQAGPESLLSLQPAAQTAPQLVATLLGHQVTWMDGATLRTRFITGAGELGDVMTLSEWGLTTPKAVELAGGSAVIWSEPGTGLHLARFDSGGHLLGQHSFPASTFVFSVSVASVDGQLLIVTAGEEVAPAYEVYATRVSGDGDLLERRLLSPPGSDGYNAVAGGDSRHWLAAWRNWANQVVVVTMDRDDLRLQSRTSGSLPTQAVAFLEGITAGPDPAVIWDDHTDLSRLHASFLEGPQSDVVMGAATDGVYSVEVRGDEVYWNVVGASSRILSAPVLRTPVPPLERGCLSTNVPTAFATRGGAVSALAYGTGGRLFVQLPPAPARPRAARH